MISHPNVYGNFSPQVRNTETDENNHQFTTTMYP